MSYNYNATVIRWVDGDTVWLEVDLGFRSKLSTEFRLHGINAPERYTDAGKQATARVNELAPAGSAVNIFTAKDPEKYGRWLCRITPAANLTQPSINDRLIQEGLAASYMVDKNPIS